MPTDSQPTRQRELARTGATLRVRLRRARRRGLLGRSCAVAAGAHCLDAGTTLIGLSTPGIHETMPVPRAIFGALGPAVGVPVWAGLMFVAVVGLVAGLERTVRRVYSERRARRAVHGAYYGFAAVTVAVACWNAWLIGQTAVYQF